MCIRDSSVCVSIGAPLGRASIARPAVRPPGEPLELLEGRLPRHRHDDALRELQRAGESIYRPGSRVLEAEHELQQFEAQRRPVERRRERRKFRQLRGRRVDGRAVAPRQRREPVAEGAPIRQRAAARKGRELRRVERAILVAGRLRRVAVRRQAEGQACLLYTSPSPRDATLSRMPSSA